MTEQWQELKETITEMRDNGGTGTQQEVCKFLANYMEILKKQMQQPCEDCISREQAKQFLYERIDRLNDDELYDIFSRIIDDMYNELPSVIPKAGWISVSERLPEENGRYLVTRGLNACGAMWNRTYILNYSDLMGLKSERIWWDGNVGKSDFKTYDDILTWMPLPTSYQGE